MKNELKRIIRENRLLIILSLLSIFIFIPLISYVLSEATLLPVSGTNDWAGFWGGYLGSIIGGIVTLIVLYLTLKHGDKDRIEDEKRIFYDRLIEYIAELDMQCKKLLKMMTALSLSAFSSNIKYDEKLYQDMLEYILEFNKKILIVELRIKIEKEKHIHKDLEMVEKLLMDVMGCMDEIKEKNEDVIKPIDYSPQIQQLESCVDDLVNQTQKMIIKNLK